MLERLLRPVNSLGFVDVNLAPKPDLKFWSTVAPQSCIENGVVSLQPDLGKD